MRAVLLSVVLVVAGVGCGKIPKPQQAQPATTKPAESTPPAATPASSEPATSIGAAAATAIASPPPQQEVFNLPLKANIYEEYRQNPAAADLKYKGKRFRMPLYFDVITRLNGKNCVGARDVNADPYDRNSHIPEPTRYYFFRDDADIAKFGDPSNQSVQGWYIECTIAGRVDDKIVRTRNFSRYDFHVRFEDCIFSPNQRKE